MVESMKSFDEWFGEASQDKLFWESPSKASKMGFEAGQQSKQAEVDGLKLKLSEDSRVLHNVIDIERRKCEELREMVRRLVDNTIVAVDDALENQANDLIKGDSHES